MSTVIRPKNVVHVILCARSTDLGLKDFVVEHVVEFIADVIVPLNVHWSDVQAAALNRLERHAAQGGRHRHQIIIADELRVTVVNREHVHLVLVLKDLGHFAAIPATTIHSVIIVTVVVWLSGSTLVSINEALFV